MRQVPETYRQADWPRKVSGAIKGILNRLTALEAVAAANDFTGWETYTHTGGAQALVAATRTALTIDGGGSITSQKPTDVTQLWDTTSNTITGRNGDAIVVKAQCVFTPSDATASIIDFDVDIGGSVGIVEEQQFTVAGGAGVPLPISWTFGAYTLDTWEANGGTINATCDGPGSITELRVVIQRTHKARS